MKIEDKYIETEAVYEKGYIQGLQDILEYIQKHDYPRQSDIANNICEAIKNIIEYTKTLF